MLRSCCLSSKIPPVYNLYTLFFHVSDHTMPVNVDAMNTAYIARSQEVWDRVEKDRYDVVMT